MEFRGFEFVQPPSGRTSVHNHLVSELKRNICAESCISGSIQILENSIEHVLLPHVNCCQPALRTPLWSRVNASQGQLGGDVCTVLCPPVFTHIVSWFAHFPWCKTRNTSVGSCISLLSAQRYKNIP